MADAADEAGEYEVGECLRFLWKHRLVPEESVGSLFWNWISDSVEEFWRRMPSSDERNTKSGCASLNRVLVTWPKHKHLLIDALEKETVA